MSVPVDTHFSGEVPSPGEDHPSIAPERRHVGGVLRLVTRHDMVTEPEIARLTPPPEIIAATCARLKELDMWQVTPKYGEYDHPDSRMRMLGKLESIAQALRGEIDDTSELAFQLESDIAESRKFINDAFASYGGEKKFELSTSFVFVVPTRVSRPSPDSPNVQDQRGEVEPFLKVASYLDPDILQRFIAGLPPCVIESYTPHQGRQGRILFVPVFTDMRQDIPDRQQLLITGAKIVNDAARFANDELGAMVMGLGATLPRDTLYGRAIHQEGIETTTGHGGTAYLIGETVDKVLNEAPIEAGDTIGVIGAGGSIAKSTIAMLLDRYPDKKILLQDKKPDRLAATVAFCESLGFDSKRLVLCGDDLQQVIAGSNLLISATTTPIDLEDQGGEIDLRGKVLVDDSQPGCFKRDQVEARGGKLLWVVGSADQANLERVGGYNFGAETGLVNSTDVWGCEGEAYAITATGRTDLAIQEAVTPQRIREIGELFRQVGITAATFQSCGQLVEFEPAA